MVLAHVWGFSRIVAFCISLSLRDSHFPLEAVHLKKMNNPFGISNQYFITLLSG